MGDGEDLAQVEYLFRYRKRPDGKSPVFCRRSAITTNTKERQIISAGFFVTGGPEGSEGLYYSMTYANVHITVVDEFVNVRAQYLCPETVFLSACLDSTQMDWLRNDLSQARNNPDIDFIFLALHSGPYSSKEGRSGYAQIRQMLRSFRSTALT